MAAALGPPGPAMERPPGRGLLPGLRPAPGAGRAAAQPGRAAEPPWGFGRTPRPPTYSLPPSPAGRRGLDELSRSLAWPLGGPAPAGQRQEEEEEEAAGAQPCPPAGPGLKFGLLPPELHARLLDQEDYRSRTQAVEELKRVVGGASQAAVTSAPASSLLGLLSLLCTLLDDSNFKVVLGALEVIHLLALRLGDHVQGFLTPLVSAAAKVLGDNKLAIRQEYSRLFLQLMKAAGPQQVLALLLLQQFLRHKNSRVREEVVNICIVALLTYPSEEMDLAKLAFGLAPALVDSKPRVRHAAMEAFAALASSMGPGKAPLLFKALDTVELEDNGDGVMHAVQARLARKTLPRLVDQGFVEYGVPLPSPGHSRGSRFPPGADTDWLLMGSRTRSAHSYLGCPPRDDDALQSSSSHGACAEQGLSPRRVLSAGKGKKLPWENEDAGEREGGSEDKMPFTRGVEQFSTSNDFLHSPKLRPSQGIPVSDELFFSRKRASRSLFQNSIDFNSERSSVCAGAMGSHQPQISGKCGALGYTQPRGKSDSVDSDLQGLRLNTSQQDKVSANLNFSSKIQKSSCNQAESSQGPHAGQGTFILPSYPLSSPRSSPKHLSSPSASPKKPQENTTNLSNSWPLKSFEGLPNPSSQTQLLSLKAGESLQEKHSPLQLKPTLVKPPASRRALSGARPVPPIPRLPSPLPDKMELSATRWRSQEGEDLWLEEVDKNLAELNVDDEEEDQEEMQNSLRSLRNSAAKKRAKLSSNILDLGSPDSALKVDFSGDSPSHASPRSLGCCSESGVYSQEPLPSPVPTVPRRRRIMSDTFPLLGRKPQPGRASSARSRAPDMGEHNFSTGLAESTPHFPQMNSLDFLSPGVLPEDAAVTVGKGVLGSLPPAGPSITCVANGDDQAVRKDTEPSSGRSTQHSSVSHFHVENEGEMKIPMSKCAQDKVRRKKKEEHNHKEHQEVRDLEEKEENLWERLKLNELEKMTTEKNMALNPSLKRTSSLKKARCSALLDSDDVPFGTQRRCKDWTSSVTRSPEILDPSELQPFAKPETALEEALLLVADDDWEKKIQGLNSVRSLSASHAAVLTANLHETCLAVAQEVKNLRSGVSRAAVVCLGDLFTYLKKSMDQELDNTVKVLLHKAGESNTFIREEVDKALNAMVNNVTPARALCSLINGGQSHLHWAVRRCAAQHLSDVVERLGARRLLSGARAVVDRLLPAVARFTQDSSQQTRFYGRKMLFSMMAHPDFDRTLEKYVPTKDLLCIKECVSNLRDKGLGEMPLDTSSAKGRRSYTGSVGRSRSSSISRDVLNITERASSFPTESQQSPMKSQEKQFLVMHWKWKSMLKTS
ncbi:TOG array regulator of axonemal microtubules protein 1 isoform X2 [Apus apus]|uniref:TOG array regulator of axonemal microtubules protein 1 isoform X2 n=1 Tax=Apus apus TaxID=8895 RepID=UPI0021F8B3FD|nr:TOG array regulator of axonemal microtubules protein 1 isoform X2 [Apus apus]